MRLREFVELHGVTQGAVADHGLTPQQMQELGMIVARSCQLCQVRRGARAARNSGWAGGGWYLHCCITCGCCIRPHATPPPLLPPPLPRRLRYVPRACA